MTYQLYLGDRTYSSWSLRGWLLFEKFGIPVNTTFVDFSGNSVADQISDLAPARTVPTLVTPEGAYISESLAIAEEIATRHPDAGLWPTDPLARATARTLAAEMHAGFGALRDACPMNLRLAYDGFVAVDDVLADVARLELIWSSARNTCGTKGDWLCGNYSAADAFFAPAAARIAGYGLPVGAKAQDYVNAQISDPVFRRWRAMGFASGQVLPRYGYDFPLKPWPGPKTMPARPVSEGPPENSACPYSGKAVTHFLETGGRVFGFCNAFCRDKTVADPEAWDAFMEIYRS